MDSVRAQVGDRLIPVGYTSSRTSVPGTDTGPITTEMTQEAFQQFMAAAAGGRGVRSGSVSGSPGSGGARRSSRRGEREGVNDLEEMMLMEAMRLSMLEHEEQQKREAEAKRKAEQQQGSAGEVGSKRWDVNLFLRLHADCKTHPNLVSSP